MTYDENDRELNNRIYFLRERLLRQVKQEQDKLGRIESALNGNCFWDLGAFQTNRNLVRLLERVAKSGCNLLELDENQLKGIMNDLLEVI
jgi:hypothetical protein